MSLPLSVALLPWLSALGPLGGEDKTLTGKDTHPIERMTPSQLSGHAGCSLSEFTSAPCTRSIVTNGRHTCNERTDGESITLVNVTTTIKADFESDHSNVERLLRMAKNLTDR